MNRATQISTTEFLYPMWVKELKNPNTMMGDMEMSVAGTHIVYQAQIHTPYITLESRESGWLNETNMTELIALYNQLDTTFTLTYSDASTDTVRFAHEKGIIFKPTHEGSCYYYATINLAKVV